MIDWKRVEELRSEIGADGFVEVADMFLDEAGQAVQALVTGLPEGEIEAQLHFLKGSALNLGFAELASLCQDGERKAAAGYGSVIDTARIAALYHASRALLIAGMADGRLREGTAA
ncbi:MAG: Hpt domain-containing protein [Tabrizicola sp.]|jgi:HPt (histidine-containing phosphotransfer) domain-containing protein|nr:Hpt domain-containing protein [Tabrizicola sp.]